MKMCLVMILVKKVFIFSKTMIICLLCPLLCGLFFFWKGAKGELSYKAKIFHYLIMKNGLKYVFEAVITESQMICSCMQLNYATGCTEHCFLSLPFLSKRTIPSTNANNVSSPPRPTLTPG